MKKRVLAILLALAMVAALLPVAALADGNVAAVGNQEYETLQAAFEALENSGGTITLLNDTDVSETIAIDKTLTIDLGSHTITGQGVRVFQVTTGNLTLAGNGTVTTTEIADADQSVIRVGDNSSAGTPSLTIEAGVTVAAANTYGVTVFGSATSGETVHVYGTVTSSDRPAISGNGAASYQDAGTSINIYDGAVVTTEGTVAIYHPQAGELNITGGTITGTGGIEAKSGTINISGDAVVRATGTTSHNPNSDGTSTDGYGVAAVTNDAYAGDITVTISGNATVEGPIVNATDEQGSGGDPEEDIPSEPGGTADISITGGNFTANVTGFAADDAVVAVVTHDDTSTYHIGETAVQSAAAQAVAGDTIAVEQGDIALTGVAGGVTVTAAYDEKEGEIINNVTVNGVPIVVDDSGSPSYTVPEGEPGGDEDTDPDSGNMPIVYPAPTIIAQPQATVATAGGVATFSVTAVSGNPYNINDFAARWMVSEDGITWREVGRGTTLQLPVTIEDDGLLVRCTLQTGSSRVDTTPVTLTVLPGMDIVPGEEEIIDPGEEEGDVQEGTENTPSEEGDLPEEGLEELPEEGEDLPEEPVDVPKTGDSMPSVGLALLFGLAACAVVLKKARAK